MPNRDPGPVHFDPDRLESLATPELLDGSPALAAASLDRFARLAARALDAPLALIALVDEQREIVQSVHGAPSYAGRELPRSSLSDLALVSRQPLLVADTRAHEPLRDHPALVELGAAALAAAPIVQGEHALGALLVLDRQPHRWRPDQLVLLADLAAAIAGELELRLAARTAQSGQLALAALFDNTTDAIWSIDRALRLTAFNKTVRDRFEHLVGRSPRIGMRFDEVLDPAVRDYWRGLYARALAGEQFSVDQRYSMGGVLRDFLISFSPIRTAGRIVGATVFGKDITEHAKTENALREQTEVLQAILEHMGDGVVVGDTDGRTILVNAAAERIVGSLAASPIDRWPGTGPYGMYLPDGASRYRAEDLPIARATRGEDSDQIEVLVRSPEHPEGVSTSSTGRPLRDKTGRLRGGICVIRDVTEEKRAQRLLEELATVDELTGLYNRRGFLRMAAQQLQLTDRNPRPLHLFFADIDDMKRINDALGHEAGDQALAAAAAALKATFRKSDIIGRLGGDEFVALVVDAASTAAFVQRLEANLRSYNGATARPYTLAISVGITAYDPSRPETIESFLTRADAAMYRQKRARKRALTALYHPQLNR
jgi:diguanylate cyclase (GGDEF)-like protein/PAS domain S-box-containing protein